MCKIGVDLLPLAWIVLNDELVGDGICNLGKEQLTDTSSSPADLDRVDGFCVDSC